MSVLDEPIRKLQEARDRPPDMQSDFARGVGQGLEVAEKIFRTFDEAHPGLVDYTSHCVICGKPVNPAECPTVRNFNNEVVGDICPECAEKASKEVTG